MSGMWPIGLAKLADGAESIRGKLRQHNESDCCRVAGERGGVAGVAASRRPNLAGVDARTGVLPVVQPAPWSAYYESLTLFFPAQR